MHIHDRLLPPLALALLAFASQGLHADTVTGRPRPVAPAVHAPEPTGIALIDCRKIVDEEVKELSSTKMGAPSAAAIAQKMKECESRNQDRRESNRVAAEQQAGQAARRQAEDAKRTQAFAEAVQLFDAEEEEVRALVARWKPKVRPDYLQDAARMLKDNAHLAVGKQVVGTFRLLERTSPTTALAWTGRSVVKIDGIPADTKLYSDSSLVLIADVVKQTEVERYGSKELVPLLAWIEGGDCRIAANGGRPGGCLPWLGLRKAMGAP